MMAKPIRALELHYPMIQFLINTKYSCELYIITPITSLVVSLLSFAVVEQISIFFSFFKLFFYKRLGGQIIFFGGKSIQDK